MSAQAAVSSQPLAYVDPAEFTPFFGWKKGKSGKNEEVLCEGVSLAGAARRFGSPLYLYSRAAMEGAYKELDRGLGSLPHTLCFAVKSNGNLTILKTLAKVGSGFDVVSANELLHLQHLGVPGNKIVFSGVGKSREEIRIGLRYNAKKSGKPTGILLFNVESEEELEVLLEEAAKHVARGGRAPGVAIRVNPDVQAGGHPHISTGRYEHKFGLDWDGAFALYRKYAGAQQIAWDGISAHIGSQITDLEPFREALRRIVGFVSQLRSEGIKLRYLDFGGGLGVRYTDQHVPSRESYAELVASLVKPLGAHLLLEPGRNIIAPAGVLLTQVRYVKNNGRKRFIVVDAAMNDLMRPSLYGAVHAITKVTRAAGEPHSSELADIVGPVCETGDCFLRGWPMGEVKAGDVLAIWAAGAYGMSLASNYNARVRPGEVLVDGKNIRVIRKRESLKDLLRGDVLA
ncbi:MAG: diaminopimelate decarboxylase [Acidobacteria bacterium]|nr:diaminopimelate decarboxylase [Acidobacteriota bacterium]MBS1867425.1 diaminopimelate decarboxylase [Acidobacteriota bacterium]